MNIPVFDSPSLRRICSTLVDYEGGLTGTEIGMYLTDIGIQDSSAGTKRYRLFEALDVAQKLYEDGEPVAQLIGLTMKPVNYSEVPEVFESMRKRLNTALALCGFLVGEDGKLRAVELATTLQEAQERASRLSAELVRRRVHPDVLRFCNTEWVRENYFHAVLEATKSIASKIKQLTGLNFDGSQLVDSALGGSDPILIINPFITETEKSEQRGFTNLLKGLFGTFRNPTAHEAKIEWPVSEQDALDLMTLASYAHRRLDGAIRKN